jgi:hypothetical protein
MKSSHFSEDIQEFLYLLDKYQVRYVIVGGEAVIFYGYVRLTGDIDFYFEPVMENAKRLYDALNQFWDGDIPGIKSQEELLEPGIIIQFGAPPNRIDLINKIEGVIFTEAWEWKTIETITRNDQIIPVYFIGIKQLIRNKASLDRPKDMDDLKYLKKRMEKENLTSDL